MRFKLADANDPRDFEFADRLERHRAEVEAPAARAGRQDHDIEYETEYAFRATLRTTAT